MMRISVVIPVLNRPVALREAIESVAKQTVLPDEVIVVDDGSSDNSSDIARSFNCRIIELKDNKGEGNARNKGVEEAKGEYLFFVDSDIYIEEDTLQVIYDRIKKDNR